MRLPALLAASLVVTLAAGCLTGDDADPDPAPAPVVDPAWATRSIFGDLDPDDVDHIIDHDHADRLLHTGLSTPNFEVLGWDPLVTGYYESPAGTTWCGDVALEGDRRLAVVHSFASDVAMEVIDVTDVHEPVLLGELVLPFVQSYDVAIFPDGRYAAISANLDTGELPPLLAAEGVPAAAAPGTMSITPLWRDACTGETRKGTTVDEFPYGYSTILVDLADPENPLVADFLPHAVRNMHSVSTAMVDGTRFVASSGLGGTPCSVAGQTLPTCQLPRGGNLLSYWTFFTVEETPLGARLVPHSVYSSSNPGDLEAFLDPDLLLLSNGHTDATIQKHPVTGETIAYLANWNGGFVVVRLDGPGEITHLYTWGTVDPTQGSQMTGQIHSVRPSDTLTGDGRHITLVGQEVVGRPEGRPTGQIVLFDTTDPGSPEPVARWTLPVDAQWTQGLMFSTHYPVLVNDTLFVTVYHAGLWAADASPDAWPELPSIGVFMPDRAPISEPATTGLTPEVLEVLPLDGSLVLFDGDSGVYTLRFTGPHPDVPPAAPWTADAWLS